MEVTVIIIEGHRVAVFETEQKARDQMDLWREDGWEMEFVPNVKVE
jgi:hypothetical protein